MTEGGDSGGCGGGGGGSGGNKKTQSEVALALPHPVKEQLPDVQYCINSPPPWRQYILFIAYFLSFYAKTTTVCLLRILSFPSENLS